jgi:hypothetical protein
VDNNIPKEYIERITKATAYFIFRNGPIKKLKEENKVSDEEVKEMQRYMQNHLAYLYNVLFEENDLNKFNLIVSTMDKFYINDEEKIIMEDDEFEKIYINLFKTINNGIDLKK